MKNKLLVIFAKNPVTEKIKTRFAKKVGKEKAKEVYEELLLDLIKSHSKAVYDLKLYIKGEVGYFLKYLDKKQIVQQQGSDLGERMLNTFRQELNTHKKVVIIGSDTLLSADFIEGVFKSFNEDCVIGPAIDGGYYLIGFKEVHDVFQDIEWSTSNVLKHTIGHLNKANLKVKLLENKRDIDDYEDYVYYKEKGVVQ